MDAASTGSDLYDVQRALDHPDVRALPTDVRGGYLALLKASDGGRHEITAAKAMARIKSLSGIPERTMAWLFFENLAMVIGDTVWMMTPALRDASLMVQECRDWFAQSQTRAIDTWED